MNEKKADVNEVTIKLENGKTRQGQIKRKSYIEGKLWRVGIKTDEGFIYLTLTPQN